MNAFTTESVQLILLLALALNAFVPKARHLVRRLRSRRDDNQLSERCVDARRADVRGQAETAAHRVANEAKNRLWFMQLDSDDVG